MHAGAAITAPNAGALLTGLATAVASVLAGISCPRRYHCPFVGCVLSCLRCALAEESLRGLVRNAQYAACGAVKSKKNP